MIKTRFTFQQHKSLTWRSYDCVRPGECVSSLECAHSYSIFFFCEKDQKDRLKMESRERQTKKAGEGVPHCEYFNILFRSRKERVGASETRSREGGEREQGQGQKVSKIEKKRGGDQNYVTSFDWNSVKKKKKKRQRNGHGGGGLGIKCCVRLGPHH